MCVCCQCREVLVGYQEELVKTLNELLTVIPLHIVIHRMQSLYNMFRWFTYFIWHCHLTSVDHIIFVQCRVRHTVYIIQNIHGGPQNDWAATGSTLYTCTNWLCNITDEMSSLGIELPEALHSQLSGKPGNATDVDRCHGEMAVYC